MPLEENIASSRVHWEMDELSVEGGFDREEIERIGLSKEVKHRFWENKAFFFGGAHSVGIDSKGHITAVGDLRRTGTAITVM